MEYIEYLIAVDDDTRAEIHMAWLVDMGFDSFEQQPGALKAFIARDELERHERQIADYLATEKYTVSTIAPENWNRLWESNFEPVEIDGGFLVRAPFHAPAVDPEREIVIMPKMSFGTGHHATTHLMVAQISSMDLAGMRGLDMGSGTGILAIAAVRRGAAHVDTVDIDEWAYENCIENVATNGAAERITVMQGDASAVAGRRYDFILANINRNVLLADMDRYAAMLAPGGRLIMSGILTGDVDAIVQRASEAGLAVTHTAQKDKWALIGAQKS